ncbi:hypothetical protein D3C80_1502790 [compost metagenome]
MLINQAVTGIVPDKLDRHVQLVFALHAVTLGGHFRPTQNGIGPHEHGDAGFNRILQGRHPNKRQAVGAFARARVTAMDPDVTGEDRQHGDGT